jgi:uncharacterized membrane protein HdeD (DUF308 family)
MQSLALDLASPNWRVMGVRGLLALLFGFIAFFLPRIDLLGLACLFATFAVLDGIMAIYAAWLEQKMVTRRITLLTEGLVSIIIGSIVVGWINMATPTLLHAIALWAITTGIAKIITSFMRREAVSHNWGLAVAGFLSLLSGLALLKHLTVDLYSALWIMGALAIVGGAELLLLALQLRSLRPIFTADESELSRSLHKQGHLNGR